MSKPKAATAEWRRGAAFGGKNQRNNSGYPQSKEVRGNKRNYAGPQN